MGEVENIVEADEGVVFDVELDEDILKANQRLADENRRTLNRHGILAIDVMGSIGAGKTSLIEQLVKLIREDYRVAVFKGDLTTTIDAEKIQRQGVKVVAINTGKECHLDANLVKKALLLLDLNAFDLLIIENVGNLICPGEFPLGSEKRVVVISVTEGPYMVVKHPFIFIDAQVVVINKMDLAEAMEVNLKGLESDVLRVNPRARVVFTNCRSGEGVDGVVEALSL